MLGQEAYNIRAYEKFLKYMQSVLDPDIDFTKEAMSARRYIEILETFPAIKMPDSYTLYPVISSIGQESIPYVRLLLLSYMCGLYKDGNKKQIHVLIPTQLDYPDLFGVGEHVVPLEEWENNCRLIIDFLIHKENIPIYYSFWMYQEAELMRSGSCLELAELALPAISEFDPGFIDRLFPDGAF